jgi:thioredoxin 1
MVLTDATFKSEIEDFGGVAVVDFWAEWCTPCKMIDPIVEELEQEHKSNSNVKFLKLNVDENPQTSQRFGVMSIPTLIFFKGGQPVGSIVGVQPKDNIVAELERALE